MKEVARQPRSTAIWIALALVVLMLGGIAWMVLSYLRGSSPVVVAGPTAVTETPHQGQHPRRERVAPRHDLMVPSGPYVMTVHRPDNSDASEFQFSMRLFTAFKGEDLKLMSLASNLVSNPDLAQEAGAPEAQIKQLRDSLGERLNLEPLRVSDASAQACKSLWEKYIAATSPNDREVIREELRHAVSDACSAAREASQPDFAVTVAEVRRLIPQEQQYQENIAIARNKKTAASFAGLQVPGMPPPPKPSTHPSRPATQPSTRP